MITVVESGAELVVVEVNGVGNTTDGMVMVLLTVVMLTKVVVLVDT